MHDRSNIEADLIRETDPSWSSSSGQKAQKKPHPLPSENTDTVRVHLCPV